MRFYRDRKLALLWMAMGAMNIVLALDRYHRGEHGIAWFQGITGLGILLLWGVLATTHWIFKETALEQRMAGFLYRSVPYDAITSVDAPAGGKQRAAAIVIYARTDTVSFLQKLSVEPKDFPAFMAELERRTPQAAVHV